MEEEKCFLTFTCALDGDLLISLLPSLVQSRWSAAEELDGDGGESVVGVHLATVRRLFRVRRTGCPQAADPAILWVCPHSVAAANATPPVDHEYSGLSGSDGLSATSRRLTPINPQVHLRSRSGRPSARIDRLVSRVVTPYALCLMPYKEYRLVCDSARGLLRCRNGASQGVRDRVVRAARNAGFPPPTITGLRNR